MGSTREIGIERRAVVVRLSISNWVGRKYDKKVTTKIEREFQSKDSGRWNKILIAKDAVKQYSAIAKEARDFHYKMTLPWGDNGDRILPVAKIDEYREGMDQRIREYTEQVSRFCQSYPVLVEQAREHLNGMFDPDDYPSASHIQYKFGMSYNFIPVMTGADFRIDMDQESVEEIKRQANEYHSALIASAKRSLWERIYYPLARLVERLSKADLTFRDSLIGNVTEILDVLDALNLDGDQAVTNMKLRIASMLAGLTPDSLREERKVRTEVSAKALELVEEIGKTLRIDTKDTMRKLRMERGLTEDGRKIKESTRKIRV